MIAVFKLHLILGLLVSCAFASFTAPAETLFPMPKCQGLDLEEATVSQLQDWMSRGLLNSKQLVACYVQRIHQVDSMIESVIEINPDAFVIADELDREREAGFVRGPMHGIPVLVKDSYATADKMQTSAGSLALVGSIVPRDAHAVKLMREAGAIILGHSNLSEWAEMRSTSFSEGFSGRGGQARNSFNLTQKPGGSSSGSAHAVSANLVTVAYGTETDGSIISPAERASIIGIKGTVGLISRAGIIPESHSQDTLGSFGRTFEDAVIAFQTIVGIDPRDPKTFEQEGKALRNYTDYLSNKTALQGARFGIPWKVWTTPSTKNQLPTLLAALNVIAEAGATIYNNTEYKYADIMVSPDGWDWTYGPSANMSEYTIVTVDFYNNIRDYLSELSNTNIRSLEDIMAFNDVYTILEGGIANSTPAFESGQDGFAASLATHGAYNETYHQARDWIRYSSREMGIDYALNYTTKDGDNFLLDALLVPSDDNSPATNVPAQAGYPMLTLPVGFDSYSQFHCPFGLSLIGTAYSEAGLIKYGSAIDDALGVRRRKPYFYEYGATNIPVLQGRAP
ncbi:amidase family protein [Fistulina hepatica ATCC 64428]|uniref:Amidase family protein n=1 Tax=Fistulina hepatica ATCC 64428 TaxID=1128425 RepID=A0A0D7ALB5_9AGAR|nr:amidase family protein [Fistulina hepatica ATCC 64428]